MLGEAFGPYRILGKVGEGGMGEVFRARDTRLNRDVALKVLPDAFADDADRLARFTREAHTLASLNHPHIAAIYGFEEGPSTDSGQAGVRALVMELVEGDDLSQRLARGVLPLDEALPIARQIAEALEAAHERGIVHRDLKPANIKVQGDGTVKVLDFGLAKAMDPAQGSGLSAQGLANSPTLTAAAFAQGYGGPGTQMGMIIGTAAYMAPEQARGRLVDRRADIWAFGVVLYEMLSGQRAFAGEDISDVLAAVLRQDVDWTCLPSTTPQRVHRLLERCLDRDPRTRLRDIGEARVALAAIESGAPETSTIAGAAPVAALPASSSKLPWTVAGTLGVALAATLVAWPPWRTVPTPPETRVDIVTPATDDVAAFALSPDGLQIVFAASEDGVSRLWWRSLATTTAQRLPGTERARHPFWAPDGKSIGFFAEGALKRLDLGRGAPQTLAPAVAGVGGTWNADGVIVFGPAAVSPLLRMSAAGGPTAAVTTLGAGQQAHDWPWFLRDGRRFLFHVAGASDTAGVYLGGLDGRAPTRLTPASSAGVSMPAPPRTAGAFRGGDLLLWVRAGTLVAQRLDERTAALTGDPLTLADGVAEGGLGRSAISAAATGLVAYRTGTGSQRQLTWVDRSGTARGSVGDPDGDELLHPRVSPDGRRVAVTRTVQGNIDIWLLDGARRSRFTFDTAEERAPLWSPDGVGIAFRSNRTGLGDLMWKRADGAEAEMPLVISDTLKVPSSWSADGRFLLYTSIDPQTGSDVGVAPVTGDRAPSAFLKAPFRQGWGAFSPDGRWVAYHSDESGRNEIYVRPFVAPGAASPGAEAPGGQWQVSTAGGVFPLWRPDGKELYFINPAGAMMAAPITVTRATFDAGAPIVLFPTRILGGGEDGRGRQYDLAPDGRFLINTVLDSAATPITLLQHWNPAVKP